MGPVLSCKQKTAVLLHAVYYNSPHEPVLSYAAAVLGTTTAVVENVLRVNAAETRTHGETIREGARIPLTTPTYSSGRIIGLSSLFLAKRRLENGYITPVGMFSVLVCRCSGLSTRLLWLSFLLPTSLIAPLLEG